VKLNIKNQRSVEILTAGHFMDIFETVQVDPPLPLGIQLSACRSVNQGILLAA